MKSRQEEFVESQIVDEKDMLEYYNSNMRTPLKSIEELWKLPGALYFKIKDDTRNSLLKEPKGKNE